LAQGGRVVTSYALNDVDQAPHGACHALAGPPSQRHKQHDRQRHTNEGGAKQRGPIRSEHFSINLGQDKTYGLAVFALNAVDPQEGTIWQVQLTPAFDALWGLKPLTMPALPQHLAASVQLNGVRGCDHFPLGPENGHACVPHRRTGNELRGVAQQ
jgi:hypothetical protein